MENVHTRMHTHTHVCIRIYMLLNFHTPIHACTHAYIYILEYIKLKQAITMKKNNNKYIDLGLHVILSYRGMFLVIILPKSYLNLHTFIHMYANQHLLHY